MRRLLAVLVMSCVVAVGMPVMAPASAAPASAATTRFTSCDAMHEVYRYGIAMSRAAATRAVSDGMYRPRVKPQVYADSYKTLDRDKDGVMCEVPR
ncbi:MAG: excalibur calcium-binding domain-containing protein [Actinomycetota bacterium]|nr:excalibur calcium-binding domain-containing protein [Actinomycetota bacterium]